MNKRNRNTWQCVVYLYMFRNCISSVKKENPEEKLVYLIHINLSTINNDCCKDINAAVPDETVHSRANWSSSTLYAHVLSIC